MHIKTIKYELKRKWETLVCLWIRNDFIQSVACSAHVSNNTWPLSHVHVNNITGPRSGTLYQGLLLKLHGSVSICVYLIKFAFHCSGYIFKAETKPRKCVAQFCSNFSNREQGISINKVPDQGQCFATTVGPFCEDEKSRLEANRQ